MLFLLVIKEILNVLNFLGFLIFLNVLNFLVFLNFLNFLVFLNFLHFLKLLFLLIIKEILNVLNFMKFLGFPIFLNVLNFLVFLNFLNFLVFLNFLIFLNFLAFLDFSFFLSLLTDRSLFFPYPKVAKGCPLHDLKSSLCHLFFISCRKLVLAMHLKISLDAIATSIYIALLLICARFLSLHIQRDSYIILLRNCFYISYQIVTKKRFDYF